MLVLKKRVLKWQLKKKYSRISIDFTAIVIVIKLIGLNVCILLTGGAD